MPHRSVCLKNLSMYVLSFFLITTLLSCLALKCCYQLSLNNLLQQHRPELRMYVEFIMFYLPIAHVHKNVESSVSVSSFKSGLLACSTGPLSPFLRIVGDTMYVSYLLGFTTIAIFYSFIAAIICSSVHFFFFSIAGVCIIADRL